MLTLIDNTVSETIKHSDKQPIASDAATAWVRRDEAATAERPLKPAAFGDRIMVVSFKARANHRDFCNLSGLAGNIAAELAGKMAK